MKKNQKLIIYKVVKDNREKLRLRKIINESFTFFKTKKLNNDTSSSK